MINYDEYESNIAKRARTARAYRITAEQKLKALQQDGERYARLADTLNLERIAEALEAIAGRRNTK